ncbi:nocobactin polyketide synthase NbtC [Mycobacterium intracellulare]|uniref:nocobactin polyketide synthase NbtC n=1 Tax=Mycobacterium intracellulare TaxID=1767 RepID=UPI0027DF13E6|nr:nocobactin polyketide synthase NbtC [Mycobacterium intracellulare]MEE3754896.1 nocobactin polyketide synthase NbtC [Mycobacterium intracellulare]
MAPVTYRLPNGAIPVLLSAESRDLLREEAAGLLSYAADHPEVAPDRIAEMLFRTRIARRHRALAMVTHHDELISALRAVIDEHEHPSLVRTNTPASTRRLAYVFPGQGGQRPGMGRLFYESLPAFRTEADRCAEAFQTQFGESPLKYLLDDEFPAEDSSGVVQPALFTQMAGLAAMWRSFGIAPNVTIGHSQGEIAAAYVSGMTTLADAALVVGLRARAADEFASGDYAMAVVAADRDTCEDLLARCSGWAQLSVVNSPSMVGISGDQETVQGIVDTLTERGTFARVIAVQYPAHSSLINELATSVRASMQRQLQNPKFLDTDIDCLGGTLGGPIMPELPVDEYWFWNLRNTVRFDKAIATAVRHGIDTFVEMAEHPTLQLAIHENLAVQAGEREAVVVGTSERTATDLGEFTRGLAQVAVHDLDYSWECLRTESDCHVRLPLRDFPNTRMNETRLWLPYNEVLPVRARQSSAVTPVAAVADSARGLAAEAIPARLLVEEWVRLSQRSLMPPRAIGIVDHTGTCGDLATTLCVVAEEIGAAARMINTENSAASGDLDTLVILVPQSPELDDAAAAAEVATFFADRSWWPGIHDALTDCWLVTVGGEAVVADDAPPDPVHAAASAGFRSIGADYPGIGFRHLDLPRGLTASDSAHAILMALHTAEESELALRNGGLYAKRLAEGDTFAGDRDTAPLEHVLIIGGTGNLGLEFCEHFAHRGAQRITLVSRSGETAAVADRLQHIRSATATQIRVTRCDVDDQAAVSRLATENQGVPADLIIHAAVEYSAVDFLDITAEKVDQALRAKVVGIWRILGAFPRTDNCRVVLCSSARATIGGRGQVVYAAANRMLDAMAHRLRAQGLDCVSVQWGQWTVHFDLDATSMAQLAGIGVVPMSPADAIALGMRRLPGNAIVAAFDFPRARSVLEVYGYGPLLSRLTSPVAATSVIEAPAPVEETGLPQRLVNLLAEAIGVDRAETIDTTAPMVAIGLDSLQALELRRRVKAEFNHDLEVSELLGGASLADVLTQLGGPGAAP